ncbi:MAG: DUF1801 domain-containing protein [Flavipsychrobacter sp.]|nr:DUF1801 domain-containing protein [Flavipsychrobacter sp.]
MADIDERVDQYIATTADFAQPILHKLRAIVHKACPEAEETIKWNIPCFLYNGALLCSMASFKKHCVFTFWNGDKMEDPQGILYPVGKTSMCSLGQIKEASELPADKLLSAYIKEAMRVGTPATKKG